MATATVLTIGNELVSGDVPNTNASWLAKRLAALGVETRLTAAVPDEIDTIAEFIRRESPRVDVLLVTGGLGGTPDDLTREAIAATFDVPQVEHPEAAAALRERFRGDPEYAARWALLPAGSRPLENPLGGAPGFAIANVYVLPGLPSEMEAMFDAIAEEFRRGNADRRLASRLPNTRERDRARARRGGRALAGRHDRLLPDVRRRRTDRRGRRQVARRRRARGGISLARRRARRAQLTAGRTPRSRTSGRRSRVG